MTDEDTFRALARSSPWLWSRAELDFADRSAYPVGPLHAIIERPGHTMITLADGTRHDLREQASRGSTFTFIQNPDGSTATINHPKQCWFAQDPLAEQPTWRSDGLVAQRPTSSSVVTDDPMWQNYHWIAMLDPVELADGMDSETPPELRPDWMPGTEILELTDEQRQGRAAVAAVLRTTPHYEPRCGCCALLPDERIYRYEYGDDDRHRPERWADAFRVVLDRETGICVSLRELGGSRDGNGFEVTLLSVTPWPGRPSLP